MDKARARALLDQERRRLERLGRAVARDHDDAVATSSPEDQADGADRRVTEETSQALSERLRDRWGALERAEARLAAGTYGVSVLSGRPIPDERLAADPLAELTVEEAAAKDRDLGGRREPESRMGPSRDPFQVFDDPAAQDDGLVEDDGSDDEPGPDANLGVRTTPRPKLRQRSAPPSWTIAGHRAAMRRPTVLSGDVASGLCGGCLPVNLELTDVQAVDLELLDLEVSDNCSPDRKPANGQRADGTGANSRCADRGRAKASRHKLHRGPLLPARTEPGKGP